MASPAPTAQLPATGQIFLDHVGWFVHDIAEVETVFGALGFPLTPYSVHGDRDLMTGDLKPVGTANRLAMLKRGYLEFLVRVPEGDSPAAKHLDECLARHEGVHLAAFVVAEAEAERERLTGAGIEMMPIVNLRRTVERADGTKVELAFTLNRPVFGQFPEGRVQCLVHHTPDDMWQDRYIAKDNGVHALEGVWFVADDPKASAERLARFTGRAVEQDHVGSRPAFRINLDRGHLRFMSNAAAAEALGNTLVPTAATIAAIAFKGDPDRFFDVAESEQVDAHRLANNATVIPASNALGTALIVESE
jgi:hypothetical protein